MTERIYSIDGLKLLLAMLVVVHHTPSAWHAWAEPVTTCAVPIFLMISGYLIFQREVTAERMVQSGWRMLRLFLGAFVLYYLWFRWENGSWWVPLQKEVRWLILGNVVPIGQHLWYLSAYTYILFLVALMVSLKKLRWLWYLAMIAATVHFSFDVWHVATDAPKLLRYLNGFRNFLFTGLPFFALGAWFARREIHVQKRVLLPLLVLFCAMAVVEIKMMKVNHIADVYFMTAPVAVTLFLIFLKVKSQRNLLAMMGQRYSLYIYVLHPIIIKLLRPHIANGSWMFWLLPLFVFLLSLLTAAAYYSIPKVVVRTWNSVRRLI